MSNRFVLSSVGLLLALQAILLIYSARVHSPTWDEPAHLVAGLSHWEYGRFDLYSVNPPLARTIAAAPVHFFMDPQVDWSIYSANPAYRSEVALGRALIEDNGERVFDFLFVARLMLIPVALLGTVLCFLFARDLTGSAWCGIVAAGLWVFSPDVLGYGSLISPDIATVVSGLACSYVLWLFLKSPTAGRTLLLCGVTAIAILCKNIWISLPVLYLAIFGITRLAGILRPVSIAGAGVAASESRFSLAKLVAASACAILFVNAFYGFHGSGKQLGSYTFVSRSLATSEPLHLHAAEELSVTSASATQGSVASVAPTSTAGAQPPTVACPHCGPSQAGDSSEAAAAARVKPGNRFADSWLAWIPLPLPERYVNGIDIQRRDIESGFLLEEWSSYFAGQWQRGGWWYFYLVGLLLKTPLPLLILLVAGVAALCWRGVAEPHAGAGWLALLLPAVYVLVLLSVNTGLNRHLRYAMPVLPLMCILAAVPARRMGEFALGRWGRADEERDSGAASVPRAFFQFAPALGVAVLLVCYVGVSLRQGPHWLSFFNTVAGGPENGHRWFADSTIDWGQDLLYLKSWLETHPEAKQDLHLAYFGSFNPADVGIEFEVPAPYVERLAKRSMVDQILCGPKTGWYVISKNYLAGHPMPVPSADGMLAVHKLNGFDYFRHFEPVDRIGDSMLVYHLTDEEVNPVRMQLGMQPLPSVRLHRHEKIAAAPAAGSAELTSTESDGQGRVQETVN